MAKGAKKAFPKEFQKGEKGVAGKENPFAKKEEGKGKSRKETKGKKPRVAKLVRGIKKDIAKDEKEIATDKEIIGALSKHKH